MACKTYCRNSILILLSAGRWRAVLCRKFAGWAAPGFCLGHPIIVLTRLLRWGKQVLKWWALLCPKFAVTIRKLAVTAVQLYKIAYSCYLGREREEGTEGRGI